MDPEEPNNQAPEQAPEGDAPEVSEPAPAEPEQSSEDALKELTAELENFQPEDSVSAMTDSNDAPAGDTPSGTSEPAESSEPEIPTIGDTPAESTESTEGSTDMPDIPTISDEPAAPVAEPAPVAAPAIEPEPEDEPYAPDPIDNPNPNPIADFTKVATTEEKSDDESADDQAPKEKEEPLKPAAPVPGSIGSAKSYDPAEAAKPPKVKKKLNTTMLLAIIVIVMVAAVAIFFIVSAILNNKSTSTSRSNSNSGTTSTTDQTTTQPTSTTSREVVLTCTRDYATDELAALGNPTEATDELTATYIDGEFDGLELVTAATYEDANAARSNVETLRALYDTRLSEISLTSDPFTSTYPITSSTVNATHTAQADDLDSTNASIFYLTVASDEVETSFSAISTAYNAQGYTCSER